MAQPFSGYWLADRLQDVLRWPVNLLRNSPHRFGRLLGALSAAPDMVGANHLGAWAHVLLACVFDLVGGPELIQIFWRLATQTRPLTVLERQAATEVLGQQAIRYSDVRIACGGFLTTVFKMNNNRAFATWHTINMPDGRNHNLPLLVHELTHTFQYERVGSVYIGQGLWAQRKMGKDAYSYGGADGLAHAHAAGKRYCDYNREQQGQIAQDYCALLHRKRDTRYYQPFIDQLRAGAL